MKQKKLFFRSIALLLMICISYVQFAQFGHSFHHRSASLTVSPSKYAKILPVETSCLVCDYLLHTQSKYNCIFDTTTLSEVRQDVSDLPSFYRTAEVTSFTKKSKNKSPPLT